MEKLEIFKQVGKNIHTTNISRIEQGRTNQTLLTLYRIAQALEVPLTDLVRDSTAKVAEK